MDVTSVEYSKRKFSKQSTGSILAHWKEYNSHGKRYAKQELKHRKVPMRILKAHGVSRSKRRTSPVGFPMMRFG